MHSNDSLANFKAALSLTIVLALPSLAFSPGKPDRVIPRLHSVTLRSVHGSKGGTLAVSRTVAIVHTCIYEAWSAYDEHATGIQLGGALRRPSAERTQANQEKTISYAAYRALTDLFPADAESVFKPLMHQLGYDSNQKFTSSTDIETPEGIGNVACSAVLEYRHHDNSNQLGDLAPSGKQDAGPRPNPVGPYGDWTAYVPVNPPGTVPAQAIFTKPLNPDHWQPFTYTDSSGNLVVQMFSTAHWGQVIPFALTKGDELRSALAPLPAKFGSPEYVKQAEELVSLSANLTDRDKTITEFWTSETDPPSVRWMQFAEFVAARDHLSLDEQVKLFFALSNAMMDADIAAYDAKRSYDSVRPATAIPLLFRGKKMKAWSGPGKGTAEIDGGNWIPYQPSTHPTPPSPEYVSEISAESAAAAELLRLFTGSDNFGYPITFKKGSSTIEPGVTPAREITLHWATFSEAADQAGMSSRYGGIQFAAGDLAGRKLGRLAAQRAWARVQGLFYKP